MSTALTNAKQLWTTDPQRTFSGSAPSEAGGIMEIVMDSTVYTVSIAANGSWSWQPPFPLAEGPHNLSVRTIDRAGNVGAPSLFIVNVDLTAPDQPLIIGAGDDFGDKTGLVSSGQQTDDRTPTLKGVAEPDSIVRLYNKQDQLIGSVKASSNGYWEITPTLADGEHSLYVTATDGRGYESEASNKFILNIADEYRAPDKVEIIQAVDDAGNSKGELKSGDVTDDTTPILRGTGIPGAIIEIQYRTSGGNWKAAGNATVDANGQWQIESPQLESNITISYQAREINSIEHGEWSEVFTLNIQPEVQVIVGALDDLSPSGGLIQHGGFTDDLTPILKGTGSPGQIITIEYGQFGDPWIAGGTAVVDKDGNWSWQSPKLKEQTGWEFRASNANQPGTTKWSNTLSINVTASGKESPGYLWDFNDGTLQGWKAAGRYSQSGELTVKKWSGNATNQLGSMTNGIHNEYNGEVAYRTIIVEKGKTYEVSFDALQHTSGGNYKSKLGMSIDGKSVIPETLQKTSWTHYTGYYTATETTKVKVAITNGTASTNGNDFAIDNIGIKPVEGKTDNHLTDMKTSNEVISLGDEQSSFDLANLLTEKGTVNTINMSDKIDNDLLVDVKTILQHGEINLFIENGNTQMKVNGDIGDVVKLKDLMPDSQDSVSWIQQNGNVTLAGIHYSVYNHGDAELLVQEGVKVELV
ncbi:hypothetical protein RSA31_19645 [Pantoea dispersa]|uniref:Ig-like domain-containing protein n=1 Tax=Pantoea dispersa TaxID=59814 RepID=UPI0007365720|nr:Ig-like domain-containing protein [Pantoea dispersa]KTS15473.1 hypothetical protein NS215_16550 [Pantoea dispersa]KTS86069.1 hypothetical protein RSA31_19645 [Pantoea dispersa]